MTALKERISVDLVDASAITGLGIKALRAAIKANELACHYAGTKILIEVSELEAYVRSLPTERPPKQ